MVCVWYLVSLEFECFGSLFDSATASLILRDLLMQRDFGRFECHTCHEVNGLIQDVSLQEKEQLCLRQFQNVDF